MANPVVGDKLFLYGTLRKEGSRGDIPVQYNSKELGRGTLQGARMYTIQGQFPGLKLTSNPDDTVYGEVIEIVQYDLPRLLDHIEGYPFLYDRQVVKLSDGTDAWVYTFNRDVHEDDYIKSGDWMNREAA